MSRRPRGWWVDETVPDLSPVLTPKLGIDPAAFAEWLGPKLGEYRGAVQARAGMAKPTQNLRELARDARKLAELLDDISPQAAAKIDALAFKFSSTGPFVQKITSDLRDLALFARHSHTALAGRRGRKRETARDALLADVVEHLRQCGLKATLARSVAEQVLVLSGIKTPENESAIKKAARRGKK